MSRRHKRLSQEIHFAEIEKLSHDGRGIARIDGKTTFIRGALPYEKVDFRYTKVKKDFDEGDTVAVHSASSMRVEPRCLHYSQCGGCSLQHMDGKSQIQEKSNFLFDLLRRVGQCVPELELIPLEGKQWHYRNKARLSVKYLEKSKKSFIGFREKQNPRFITALSQCAILNEKVQSELPALTALLESFNDPRIIAQIEVAAGDTDIALIFRNLLPLSDEDKRKLVGFGEKTQFRIYLQPGGVDSVQLFYPQTASSFLSYTLEKENITFDFLPTDFTQVNNDINQKMINLVMELMDLSDEDRVLDLFCGLGNFALPFAKRSTNVVGIEGFEGMVKRAEMNAKKNGIENTEFLCINLDQQNGLQRFSANRFSKIFLDPPRSGALEVVKQMNRLNPSRIVYVSCNPATLARDAEILVHSQGYKLKAAGVMDMFPHTAHVESVAVFEKQ